jgi:hypothetical protein
MSTLFGYEVVEQAQEIDRLSTENATLTADNERLRADLRDWAECASVDVTMEGPRLMGWNRSALDRCLTKYEAALQPKEGEQ